MERRFEVGVADLFCCVNDHEPNRSYEPLRASLDEIDSEETLPTTIRRLDQSLEHFVHRQLCERVRLHE